MGELRRCRVDGTNHAAQVMQETLLHRDVDIDIEEKKSDLLQDVGDTARKLSLNQLTDSFDDTAQALSRKGCF